MGTQTMYETIMDLPLFKGVGADHVSSFIEKTKIRFYKVAAGGTVVKTGDEVRNLKFILGGAIRLNFDVRDGEVSVSSVFDGRDCLGATRLFGMHPQYDVTATAEEDVSVMEFSKENYMRLLTSDPIYIMNFANLLSLYAQRIQETLRRFRRLGPERVIGEWLVLFTTRHSTGIQISGIDSLVRSYGRDEVDAALERLVFKGLINLDGNSLCVPDREKFIEYVSDFAVSE